MELYQRLKFERGRYCCVRMLMAGGRQGAISGHTSADGITVSGPTDCCASHAWGIVWPSGISALLLCPGLSWRLLKLWFHYPHLDQTFIAGSSTPHLSVGKCYDSDKLEGMSSSVLRNSMTYV